MRFPSSGGLSIVSVVVVSIALTSAPAAAQDSYWGVAADFTPRWRSLDQLDALYDAEEWDIEGKTFRIGFVRGRTMSGDWGVSYVRETIEQGSGIVRDGTPFFFADNVVLNGVEVNKFAPFTTIRDRAQIGLIVGGGVASIRGTAVSLLGEAVDVKEVYGLGGDADVKVHPLFRLEVAGAAIIAPGFKLRVSGGFHWPGTARFTIGGVYLIGER